MPANHVLLPLVALSLALGSAPFPAAAQEGPPAGHGLLLGAPEAESFLLTAEIVDLERIPVGVSKPKKVTLSDGERTLCAVFKSIDMHDLKRRMASGKVELDFHDSYKSEIAAYELAKLLDLDFVPPTVERTVQGQRGSLQIWLEDVTTEWERMQAKRSAPDIEDWNRQMHTVRLFHQLTWNADYTNVSNLLVSSGFKIWVIDSSRAFRVAGSLRKEGSLQRFSRRVLERLRALDEPRLTARLGAWLTAPQIDALLTRRDRIVALAGRRVAEQGEAETLFP